MNYHFSETINASMGQAFKKITKKLKEEGLGILTEIDVQKTFKARFDVDFKPYRIPGVCNPNFAHKVLQTEDKVGIFLPCNVVDQVTGNGQMEVSAVDLIANMQVVANPDLEPLGMDVQGTLEGTIENFEPIKKEQI